VPAPAASTRSITVGVDTHKDRHVAAVVDQTGRVLAATDVPTTGRGFAQLLAWARKHGTVDRFAVEGTGAYGAGLTRYLRAAGQQVVEVDRPNRQTRRRQGKSDPVDAEAAARAALAGTASGIPKARDGAVEAIRALRVARRSALKARTQAANQLDALVISAPEPLRGQLRALPTPARVRQAAALRPGPAPADPVAATKLAMRELAGRYQALSAEITRLQAALTRLTGTTAPRLLAIFGAGTDVAGALLTAAGDNPARMRNERAFARLCGAAPLEASSGRTRRHRLNRGGDRQANNALWRIVLVRMCHDQRTKTYVARRTAQGLSTKEIMRCLKRYVAREVYRAVLADLSRPTATDDLDAR
jgi:transposase